MPFSWEDYLSLAEHLSTLNTEQARRSSISRAYYAVFCTARNHLISKGIVPPKTGEAHQFVWEKFQRAPLRCRKLWLSGDRLRRARKLADYEDSCSNLEKETENALANAQEFFSELRGPGRICP